MGNIIVMDETTKNPVSLMGKCAGICWGANIKDELKNYNRGVDCLKSGHMRVTEYPQVYLIIDGYSARVIRELYTHIAGGPTRLQASTRYIDYEHGFDYIFPDKINSDEAEEIYKDCMITIQQSGAKLLDLGIPKEDAANLLPLGMTTKIVLRTNVRNLIDMSHQRMCTRAYWEFRELFKDICTVLSEYSPEWKGIVTEYFKPKCEVCGFCEEKNSCGRMLSRDEVNELISLGKEYKQIKMNS